MATITVRNLDDEVQRLLKQRAAAHDRSMEAEVREILTESVRASSFGRDWAEAMRGLEGEFELPVRSMPREIDFS
jgi:plasmid stability protein